MWRYHADYFLPANVAGGCLCDKELLEIGERLEPTDDLLVCLHIPNHLVRESFHRLWWLYWLAFELDPGNARYVSLLEDLAHGNGLAFCSSEAEAVW